jgi:hypothetical protein
MAYSPTIWNNGDVITAEKLNKLEEAVHYEQEEMESQEKARVEAESIRDTQETARVKAETGRASAEKARETAETNRINAENKRQTDTAAAINNCNTATDRANKAAQDAEDVVAGHGFIPSSEKGAAGGVATLDSAGKMPDSQMPDIGELTPTFTQASARANLTSGEKLKISLGKIMKWFADLKAHAFADPVNNLIETDAAYPLAAPQGKILDGKITSLIQNTITKSMLSNQQTNSTNKVPTSALVYTMQQEITKLNNEGEWSGWTSLGSAIGINFYYRYNAKLVEIRYDGTLEKGRGITGQSIGYAFGKIPPAYKPKYNIMHSIPSTSSKSLMVRLYPGTEQYSVTSQDTITTQTEYVCGCIVYGR